MNEQSRRYGVRDEGGAASPHDRVLPLAPVAKTVLFCWELGGGLGHLMQMRPLAADLAAAGHRVYLASRDLDGAASVFGRTPVRLLQAPLWASDARRFPHPVNYVQLLANVGFGDDNSLRVRAGAWRHLFLMVAPDLIIFDHAPVAIPASRGLPSAPARALIGSGFCCPPDVPGDEDDTRWGVFSRRAFSRTALDALRATAGEILGRVNRVLDDWDMPPVERVRSLYFDIDETFLTTFPELDPFPDRNGTPYRGPSIQDPADAGALRWPAGSGPRVFAYLKPSPETGQILTALEEAGCRTAAYVRGIPAEARRKFESPTLHFADRPLNLRDAARECDLAVLNGGHGATAEMLLAGRPILQAPVMLEQCLTADAVAALGAGESAPALPGSPWQGRGKLEALLTEGRYANAARRFAERYAHFDSVVQRREMVARSMTMLAAPHPSPLGGSRRCPSVLP